MKKSISTISYSLLFILAASVHAQDTLDQPGIFSKNPGYFLRVGTGNWRNGTSFLSQSVRTSRLINNSLFLSSAPQPLFFSNVFVEFPSQDHTFHEPVLDLFLGYDFSFGLRLGVRRLQANDGNGSSWNTNSQGVVRQGTMNIQEASRTQLRLEETLYPFRKSSRGSSPNNLGSWDGLGFRIGVLLEAEVFNSSINYLSTQPRSIRSEYMDILAHYLFGVVYEYPFQENWSLQFHMNFQTSSRNRGRMKDQITTLGSTEDPFLSFILPNLPVGTRSVNYELQQTKKEGLSLGFQANYEMDETTSFQFGFLWERLRYTIKKVRSPSEIDPLFGLFFNSSGQDSGSSLGLLGLFIDNLGPYGTALDTVQIFTLEAKLKF